MSEFLDPEMLKDKWGLGPVKDWVKRAANYFGDKYGLRTIYGYSSTGSVANSDHPKGRALDLMVSAKTDKAKGDKIAADAIANRVALGVTYVIWNRHIWTPEQGWHDYHGPRDHTDHVHVSFADHAGTGALNGAVDVAKGGVAAVSGDDPLCAWGIKSRKIDVSMAPDVTTPDICILSKVQVRMGLGVMSAGVGVVLGLFGVILLVAYSLGKSGVASAVPGASRIIIRTVGR